MQCLGNTVYGNVTAKIQDTNILVAYEAAEVKCRDLITGSEVRKERE